MSRLRRHSSHTDLTVLSDEYIFSGRSLHWTHVTGAGGARCLSGPSQAISGTAIWKCSSFTAHATSRCGMNRRRAESRLGAEQHAGIPPVLFWFLTTSELSPLPKAGNPCQSKRISSVTSVWVFGMWSDGGAAMLVLFSWGHSLVAVPYAVVAMGFVPALFTATMIYPCASFSSLMIFHVCA